MKSTTVIVLILTFNFVFISNFFGQVVPDEELQSPQELYDFHIDKMKSNKTAAWITLGGGIAMIVGGAAIDFADNFDFSSVHQKHMDVKSLWVWVLLQLLLAFLFLLRDTNIRVRLKFN